MKYPNMKRLCLILCIMMLHLDSALGRTLDEQFQTVNRNRRYLTYTFGSAIGMFLAFAVPLELPERDVLFSYNFEANYNLPTNISQYDLTPPDRSFFQSFNRTFIYELLQRHIDSFGSDGRNCLLNFICEINRSPVSHNGLIGHLIHTLLTPSTSESEGLIEEEEAEQKGLNDENCSKLYYCSHNFLDKISEFTDEL